MRANIERTHLDNSWRQSPTFLSVRNVCRSWLAVVAMAAVCGGLAHGVLAQTAHFAGVESVIASSGLVNPHQVAVDSSGNVYLADVTNNRVLKETRTASGFQESVVASAGLKTPGGVAVDANGNVYIVDSGNRRVLMEAPSGSTYAETVIPTSGLLAPLSIAVDASGDLYISDYDNGVVKETPSAGTYTQRFVIGTSSDGVAVDANGNVYVCAVQNNEVIKMTPSGSGYSMSYVAFGLSQPRGVAVDAQGVVYVAQTGSPQIIEEVPSGGTYVQSTLLATGSVQPQALALDSNHNLYFNDPYGGRILELAQAVNFGAQPVPATSATTSLIFSFDTGGSIAATSVVTQGATGMDFADAGTGSCTTNGASHTYSANDTCTVDVTLTPKYAGTRYGAAQLKDGSGNVLATGYVQGTGLAPQANFLPGALQSLSIPLSGSPRAIAADGDGNLYIGTLATSGSASPSVMKESWNGTGYTQSTVATGLESPTGVAVDGAGNVYISDAGNRVIYEAVPSGQGYSLGEYQNAGLATSVGVDGDGNVYFASFGVGVYKGVHAGPTTIVWSLIDQDTTDFAIAVDGQGDFFTLDGSSLLSHTSTNGSYIQSTVVSGLAGTATSVAVSPTGALYFTDGANAQILKETLINGAYGQSAAMSGASGDLVGVAVDPSGNVDFVTEQADGIGRLDYADAPGLSFATTPYGSTSSSQTVTVANAGNAPLIFPIPVSGNNPSIAAGFALNENAASACPVVGAGASLPVSLAAGSTCDLAISFSPTTTGSVSGSLVLTDNTLNATGPTYATQTIALSGAATQATPVNTLVSSAANVFVSNSVTFTAAVGSPAGMPTGTVSFYDGAMLLGTQVLSSGSAAYTTSTLAAGAHSITAAYSGDGNFAAVTSSAISEIVEDFTVGTAGGGSTSATASPGGKAVYTLAMTPPNGLTFPAPITFSVTGLPSGATATFSPASIAAGAGATNVTLTVQLPSSAELRPARGLFGSGGPVLSLGLILLPFLRGRRRVRLSRMSCWMLAGAGSLMLFVSSVGCGGGGSSGGGGGSGAQPQSYTLTVTATSGSLVHATNLTLTVE